MLLWANLSLKSRFCRHPVKPREKTSQSSSKSLRLGHRRTRSTRKRSAPPPLTRLLLACSVQTAWQLHGSSRLAEILPGDVEARADSKTPKSSLLTSRYWSSCTPCRCLNVHCQTSSCKAWTGASWKSPTPRTCQHVVQERDHNV